MYCCNQSLNLSPFVLNVKCARVTVHNSTCDQYFFMIQHTQSYYSMLKTHFMKYPEWSLFSEQVTYHLINQDDCLTAACLLNVTKCLTVNSVTATYLVCESQARCYMIPYGVSKPCSYCVDFAENTLFSSCGDI